MPFAKGDPRINRSGRPKKGTSLAELVRELGEQEDITLPDGKKIERKRALAEKIWQQAIVKGNPSFAALIYKMLDNPALRLQHEGADGEPIPTMVVVQKRSLEEWTKDHEERQSPEPASTTRRSSSGNPSPAKPKPSPAQPSRSSSEEQRGAGKPSGSKLKSQPQKVGAPSKKSVKAKKSSE